MQTSFRSKIARFGAIIAASALATTTAIAVLSGLGRLHRAVWMNHRYWFTTWRWGRVAAALLLVGAVLKVAMAG